MSWLSSCERALVVAAHPDDEVLGCGGLIARLLRVGCDVRVLVLAGRTSSRGDLAQVKASHGGPSPELVDAMGRLGVQTYTQLDFDDNRFDSVPLLRLVKAVEAFQQDFAPQVVLFHDPSDLNIDHQLVSKACLTAFRPMPAAPRARLMTFEVQSSTELQDPALFRFSPNCYVDISETLPAKLFAMSAYQSELRDFPHPRSLEGISLRARIRGSEACMEAAEAFRIVREIA